MISTNQNYYLSNSSRWMMITLFNTFKGVDNNNNSKVSLWVRYYSQVYICITILSLMDKEWIDTTVVYKTDVKYIIYIKYWILINCFESLTPKITIVRF